MPRPSKLSALGTQGTVINLVKVRALSAPFPKAARLARAFNKNMGQQKQEAISFGVTMGSGESTALTAQRSESMILGFG